MAKHTLQLPVPVKPGLQVHWLAEVAPVAGVLLLAWHWVAAETDAPQYQPWGHCVGAETPAAQNEPAGQGMEIPFWQYDPEAQDPGLDDSGGHTVPLGQAMALAVPAGQ